jgi:hypothetical protein
MKTAILALCTFTIICPWCKEVKHASNGSEFHTTDDVKAGDLLRCDAEGCNKEFRLPSTLRASEQHQPLYEGTSE